MFTGIVRLLASVTQVVSIPPGKRLTLRTPAMTAETKIGDSIAINGCCLTVVGNDGQDLSFDAGPETFARTNLGNLVAGSLVNVEPSLRVGDALGGHFVTGHVDGSANLTDRQDDRDWSTFWFTVDARLTRQMASKGSVSVDGVSLTLVEVECERFSVALIPHTLESTTLGRLKVGDVVNIETDVLAKYVEKSQQLE